MSYSHQQTVRAQMVKANVERACQKRLAGIKLYNETLEKIRAAIQESKKAR